MLIVLASAVLLHLRVFATIISAVASGSVAVFHGVAHVAIRPASTMRSLATAVVAMIRALVKATFGAAVMRHSIARRWGSEARLHLAAAIVHPGAPGARMPSIRAAHVWPAVSTTREAATVIAVVEAFAATEITAAGVITAIIPVLWATAIGPTISSGAGAESWAAASLTHVFHAFTHLVHTLLGTFALLWRERFHAFLHALTHITHHFFAIAIAVCGPAVIVSAINLASGSIFTARRLETVTISAIGGLTHRAIQSGRVVIIRSHLSRGGGSQ